MPFCIIFNYIICDIICQKPCGCLSVSNQGRPKEQLIQDCREVLCWVFIQGHVLNIVNTFWGKAHRDVLMLWDNKMQGLWMYTRLFKNRHVLVKSWSPFLHTEHCWNVNTDGTVRSKDIVPVPEKSQVQLSLPWVIILPNVTWTCVQYSGNPPFHTGKSRWQTQAECRHFTVYKESKNTNLTGNVSVENTWPTSL